MSSRSADSTFDAARALYDAGQLNRAKTLLDGLLAEHPEDNRARFALAVTCVDLGDGESAISLLENVLLESPSHASAAVYLGRAYELVERTSDAVAAFERALAIDAGRPDARDALRRIRAGYSVGPQRAEPTPSRIHDGIVGTVETIQVTTRQRQRDPLTAYGSSLKRPTDQILFIRLAADDGQAYSVEMRGREIRGAEGVQRGDRIAVPRSFDRTNTLRVDQLEVIRTGQLVVALGAGAIPNTGRAAGLAVKVVMLIAVLTFLVIVFMYVLFGAGPIHGDAHFKGVLG
jgi:tetratricopeptide (TPR) repeat protein